MNHTPGLANNHVLAEILGSAQRPWMSQIETINLPLGMVLSEAEQVAQHVYFPTTAIISLSCLTRGGQAAEVAAVGRDGVVGISAVMGGGSASWGAVVQIAGTGFRLPAQVLKAEFDAGGMVMEATLRYLKSLITQISQTAVCNRHHSVDRQLCRWLLHALDRLPGNEVVMTHEQIARALGVRREGVTESAVKLQRAGVIHYARGHITVTDRRRLERCAGECYGVYARGRVCLQPELLAA
jgi:CRP-like cAMP-binding protein